MAKPRKAANDRKRKKLKGKSMKSVRPLIRPAGAPDPVPIPYPNTN